MTKIAKLFQLLIYAAYNILQLSNQPVRSYSGLNICFWSW